MLASELANACVRYASPRASLHALLIRTICHLDSRLWHGAEANIIYSLGQCSLIGVSK